MNVKQVYTKPDIEDMQVLICNVCAGSFDGTVNEQFGPDEGFADFGW